MKICHQCGTELSDDSIFCGNCGAKQGDTEATSTPPEKAQNGKDNSDNNMAVIMAIASIFFGFISPLVFWLINKDNKEKQWLSEQSKSMLNFQITVIIGMLISAVLYLVFIGMLTMVAVSIANVVICILAAVKLSKGEIYQYPLSIRLIK